MKKEKYLVPETEIVIISLEEHLLTGSGENLNKNTITDDEFWD